MSAADYELPAEPYHDFLGDAERPRQARPRLDGFVMGMAIADLCLSLLRLAAAAVALVGLNFIPADSPMRTTAPFEIGTGLAVGLTGVIAAILLLCRKRIGIAIGWIALGFTAVNLLVSLWQVSIQVEMMSGDRATLIGAVIGGGIALLIRVVLNGLYGYALVRAARTLP